MGGNSQGSHKIKKRIRIDIKGDKGHWPDEKSGVSITLRVDRKSG